MPMLVAARLIQGLVSGPMMSVAQAILLRNYPIERRGMAIALWAMVIIIAPIFGPILGGWITDNLSWPWLFYINLPVWNTLECEPRRSGCASNTPGSQALRSRAPAACTSSCPAR